MLEQLAKLLEQLEEAALQGISNRMNQVMKTLTIVSTILAPLTFIAGI